MKSFARKLYAIALAVMSFCGVISVQASASKPQQAAVHATLLGTVRARYASVNRNIGKCAEVQRELDGRSAEGGTLTGYRSGPSFCKVTAVFYGETGKVTEEYYFWHSVLFFAIRTTKIYRKPLGAHVYRTRDGAIAKTKQERFYLDKSRLFLWLNENNVPQPVMTSVARERAQQLKKDAREFVFLLRLPASHSLKERPFRNAP